MSLQRACCCGGCSLTDCLSGDEIDSGCCRGCDDLLLWCERPSYGFTQQFTASGLAPGSPKCQWNYSISQAALPPVQAVYRYYGNRWRCVIPTTTPESLYDLPPKCPPDWNAGAQCEDASYYACDCAGIFNPTCLCNQTWLTPWRKHLLEIDSATKWLTEMTCFKGGNSLSGTVGSLYNEFLCLVHREHWWRIPSGECSPNGYIRVPGCAAGDCSGIAEGSCGNIAYQTDDLVPKWWIYACSGVPLFTFDLSDAVARGVIDSSEESAFLTEIGLKNQPLQSVLNKLAAAGYFSTKDWREQQRQDFINLNARFPGAGYDACIQNCAEMTALGPIRKRLTAPYANPPAVVPWLNRDDAEAAQQALNVGSSCFIDYPGSASSSDDYEYWSDRQWVYFRAAPGGWSWVGWDAQGAPGCVGEGFSEEEAILHGCGRNDPTCIEALKGNPRPEPCCTDNAPVCDTSVYTRCYNCGSPPPACPCGAVPSIGCNLFEPGPVATQCENLVVSPSCLGVRFAYAQYVAESKLTAQPGEDPPCLQTTQYRCLYVAKSYLVEARRSADSWNESCPWKCRWEAPPLAVFNAWPPITEGHYGIAPICDSIVVGDGVYDAADLCCSGYCWDYNYVPPLPDPSAYPCFVAVGEKNDCAATTDCPPHSSSAQIACIGFTPSCSPP